MLPGLPGLMENPAAFGRRSRVMQWSHRMPGAGNCSPTKAGDSNRPPKVEMERRNAQSSRWSMMQVSQVSQADFTRMLAALPSDRWQRAFRALAARRTSGWKVDTINFNAAMKISASSGPWAAQVALLDMRSQQLRPTAVSFVLGMAALGELEPRRWERGLGFLLVMKEAQMQVNERCLSACIGLCSRSRKWNRALKLLNPYVDEPCFNAALLGSEWYRSFALLSEMNVLRLKLEVVTLDTVLRAHQDAHPQWSRALEAVSRWAGFEEKIPAATYGAMIGVCSDAKQRQLASQLFYDMCRSNVQFTGFAEPIRALSRCSAWVDALHVLEVLGTLFLQADSKSYNAIASSCSSCWGAALEVLRLLDTGLRVDVVSAGAVLDACSKTKPAKDWQAALLFMNHCMDSGMAITSACRNAGISTFAPRQWPRALRLAYADTSSFKLDARSPASKVGPTGPGDFTVVTLGTLLSACMAALQWQRAHSTLAHIALLRIQANTVVCNSLLSGWEDRPLWRKGAQLLKTFLSGHGQADRITYNALVSACEKGGMWDLAIDLVAEMGLRGMQCSTTSINSAMSTPWEQVLATSLNMRNGRLQADSFTLTALISSLEEEGAWKQSLHMLQLSSSGQLQPHSICMNAAISACQKGDDWTSAMQLLGSFPRHHAGSITFNASMSACSRCVKWQLAVGMLCRMEDDRLLPSLITHQTVLDACYGAGHWQRTLMTYSRKAIHDVASCSVAVLASIGVSQLSVVLLGHLRTSLVEQLRPSTQGAGVS
ncbi:unnamed protein product [Symbiodinium natans]|uniref:Pentatricopeptide repeat-containing protein, chloroplastic n=1 Tax=Symbiodinium natans TaxID=878477 RepID=A0A812S8C1_9DINO|nr:unnamed protein product [Symbiodinium natans]